MPTKAVCLIPNRCLLAALSVTKQDSQAAAKVAKSNVGQISAAAIVRNDF